MKKYQFSKRFQKQYMKLLPNQQDKVNQALADFLMSQNLAKLRIHKLSGKLKDVTSISAGGDLRIHLLEENDAIVIIVLEVGSHAQLY